MDEIIKKNKQLKTTCKENKIAYANKTFFAYSDFSKTRYPVQKMINLSDPIPPSACGVCI